MKARAIKIAAAVLRKEIGPSWPLFLLKCLMRGRAIFNSTHWAKQDTAEAQYASRLALPAAIYSILSEKVGRGEAFRVISEIVVPIGCCEQWDNLRSLGIEDKKGIERLRAFYDFMGESGVGQFVHRKLLEDNDELLRYEVRDCLFVHFYEQLGMLELATLFCKVDRAFFPAAIPNYEFSRGDSWKNTAAYGKDHCVFRFEKKKSPVGEKYISKTPLLDFTLPRIQMLFEELDLAYKPDGKKIGLSYEYVKREIRAGHSAGKRKPASKVLQKRRGDSMTKTILFMALLRAGGIPCRAHFATASEGIQAWAEVFYRGEWVGAARWTGYGGAPVGPGGWKEEDASTWEKLVLQDHGVFDSPDAFYRSDS
jgi:hypothetical protein